MSERFRIEANHRDDGEYEVTCVDFPGVRGSGPSLFAAFEDFVMRAEQGLDDWQRGWDVERSRWDA